MEIDRDQIVKAFVQESREQLEMMEEAFVGLESHPEDDEAVAVAFRVVHTLKGSAASLGFPDLAGYAHEVEEILDGVRQRTIAISGDVVTGLLAVVDALRRMVADAVAERAIDLTGPRALLRGLERRRRAEAARPAGPGAASAGDRRLEDRGRTLRVDLEKLDRLLNLSGEMSVLRGRARGLQAAAGRVPAAVQEAERELDTLFLALQEEILRARMVACRWAFRAHIRTVRDAADQSGKLARLVVEGSDVEVDTSIIEHLRDPITHMVRNAVDHGIEPPRERAAAGKDPCGTVTLRAVHQGGGILIQVQDDGAGLQADRIAQRARERGLLAPADAPSERELFQLIFAPGLSTAGEVTGLSGRGVGMDVVRRNVEMLRGTLALDSSAGAGTTISVRLPLTLATIPGFGVGIGDETYVIPLDAVVECMDFPRGGEEASRPTGVISLRESPLPFIRLRDHFRCEDVRPGREKVVVVAHGEDRVGLVIDELLGETQTLIKPLGNLFRGLPGFAGSALLGDGKVALILDVPGLLQSFFQPSGDAARGRAPFQAHQA